jgi:hypothetical protein
VCDALIGKNSVKSTLPAYHAFSVLIIASRNSMTSCCFLRGSSFTCSIRAPTEKRDPDGHDWRIVEEKDKDGKSVRRYVWDSTYTYKNGDKNGAPANARYVDTQGRAIQLWGDNGKDASKEQTHGYQVVTPEAKGEVAVERLTNENGEPPNSYVNFVDMDRALKQAGYKELNIDPFHSGNQFFKNKSPTLHIIVASKQGIVEDNQSGITQYRTRLEVQS